MLITIASWEPLLFIWLSPSFLSISADALPIFSLRFETLFITHWFGLCFTFRGPKAGIHAGMSFLLPFLLFTNHTGLIFAKSFSKNS